MRGRTSRHDPDPLKRPPLWFIFSVTTAGILANSTISPNIPDVLADLGRSDSSAGLLVGSGALPGVIMAPIIGVLADRFGRRRVLLPCLVVFAVGALIAALAPTFGVIVVGRLIQGVGSAGLINLAIVLIGDHWSGADRTRLIGRNSAVLTAMLAIMPFVSGALAELTSWRVSIALATFALPVAAAGYVILPEETPDRSVALGQQLRGTATVLRQPVLMTVVLAGFLLFVVIFGVFLTALPVHLENRFGLGPTARGLVLSAPAIGATVVAANLGRIRAVVPLRPLLVSSSVLIALAAFGAGTATILVLVVAAMLIYGLGDGTIIPALQDVASSVPSQDQRASVLAAWVSAVRLGQFVGPVGAAWIFGRFSTTAAMTAGAVIFVALAVLFVFGPIDDRRLAPAEA